MLSLILARDDASPFSLSLQIYDLFIYSSLWKHIIINHYQFREAIGYDAK